MSRGRLWAIIGLVVAVLAGVVFAVLQLNGTIEDPNEFVCDTLRRRCRP